MVIRIPGLELVAPLKSRPIRGTLLGGATGLLFGLLSQGSGLPASGIHMISGFTIAGLAVGATIGALLPLMKNRWVAGLIVGGAATLGLLVAFHFWRETTSAAVIVFLGSCAGLVYAVLLWEYRPEQQSRV